MKKAVGYLTPLIEAGKSDGQSDKGEYGDMALIP